MSLEELEDKFSTVTTLRDAPEDLNKDLAKYFDPIFHPDLVSVNGQCFDGQ